MLFFKLRKLRSLDPYNNAEKTDEIIITFFINIYNRKKYVKNAQSLSILDIEFDEVRSKLTEEEGMKILSKLN